MAIAYPPSNGYSPAALKAAPLFFGVWQRRAETLRDQSLHMTHLDDDIAASFNATLEAVSRLSPHIRRALPAGVPRLKKKAEG